MRKQFGIFLAGMLVVVPFALTVYVVVSAGAWVNDMGDRIVANWDVKLPPGVGAVLLLVGVYVVGLLTRLWVFRGLLHVIERLVSRLPGIKTIYESTRDLMKLFGGDSKRMGRSVLYRDPNSGGTLLAILTNESPRGVPADEAGGKVALYVPFSYMFGGITIYVPREHIREVNLPVEQTLKLAATAQVTKDLGPGAGRTKGRPTENEPQSGT